MKIPPKPPRLDWSNSAQMQKAFSLIPHVHSDSRRYLHWDQLRNRPVPVPGTSHEEWWLATKLHRLAGHRQLPLKSVDGSLCSFVNGEPIQAAVHQIDMIAGGQVTLQSALVTPETKDRYLMRSLAEEAIHSSQFEGATTTRLVAKRMLREGRGPRDRSEQMIVNNFRTMTQLAQWRDQPLTPELVFEIHRRVTENTLEKEETSGRFRNADEPVEVGSDYGDVYHTPPPASELSERLDEMCRFANGEPADAFIHPLLRAIILHYWLAYDHPFVDGNGRTARALFYWSMLRSGYWLFEFISISVGLVRAPVTYEMAFLYSQTDGHDLTYFLLHQLDIIKNALDELHKYVETNAKRAKETERLLGSYELNRRQQALASHALRHPQHQYTIEAHQSSHYVAYQTARTDLLDMERKGLLRSSKIHKKLVFEGTDLLLGTRKTKSPRGSV